MQERIHERVCVQTIIIYSFWVYVHKMVAGLRSFSSNSPGKLNILWHNLVLLVNELKNSHRYSFSMDSTQVGVFKQSN